VWRNAPNIIYKRYPYKIRRSHKPGPAFVNVATKFYPINPEFQLRRASEKKNYIPCTLAK
jgi:hypothetical protein